MTVPVYVGQGTGVAEMEPLSMRRAYVRGQSSRAELHDCHLLFTHSSSPPTGRRLWFGSGRLAYQPQAHPNPGAVADDRAVDLLARLSGDGRFRVEHAQIHLVLSQ